MTPAAIVSADVAGARHEPRKGRIRAPGPPRGEETSPGAHPRLRGPLLPLHPSRILRKGPLPERRLLHPRPLADRPGSRRSEPADERSPFVVDDPLVARA